jgi:glycosyltransferase involved in cell wall biosynthesis
MRVCLITLDFPPFRSSGLTIYAENLARGLAARGHQITVVAAERPAAASVDHIPLPETLHIVRLPVGRADWIGLGWQAARYLTGQGNRFDIVHFTDVHFAYAYRRPYVATAWQSFRQRLTSAAGQPYHTSWRNLAFRWTYYTGARWLMELPSAGRARQLLMPSHATQTEFLQHYGVDPARAPLVYPGLDLGRFRVLPERHQARTHLALSHELPVVLYVGFSTPRKGVEYLARAVNVIPPIQLLMVGKWEAGYQERFLAALGEARSRTTLAGYVPESEMPWYYAAADTLVLPTLLEGVGFPSIEAMAAGLPVVTTTGGAASETVGPAGIAVVPADSTALATALTRVLGDHNLARQLGEAGQQRAFSMFNLTEATQRVEAVYLQVLERGA